MTAKSPHEHPMIGSREIPPLAIRETCYRCNRPKASCLCPVDPPLDVRTKIVLLMHPLEWRSQRCGTGRIACLHVKDAEIIPDLDISSNRRFRSLIDDPGNKCVLLYPGEGSVDITDGIVDTVPYAGKRLVAFLLDATWQCSRKMFSLNPELLTLDRIMFTPREKSRWIIKKQPNGVCLSTIETIHELLLALEAAGLDAYGDKKRLLRAFMDMQEYQLKRLADSGKRRYRKGGPYRDN